MRPRRITIRQRKIRIAFRRLIEQTRRAQQRRRRIFRFEICIDNFLRLQIQIERHEIARRPLFDICFFLRRKFGVKMRHDRLRDVALNLKQISNIAIVGIGPDLRIIPRINELRIDAKTIGDALDRAFQNISDAKLLADFVRLRATLLLYCLDTPMADHF